MEDQWISAPFIGPSEGPLVSLHAISVGHDSHAAVGWQVLHEPVLHPRVEIQEKRIRVLSAEEWRGVARGESV